MNKFLFFFKRPKVIVILGKGSACSQQAILQVLKPHFKIGKDVLLFEADKGSEFFLKRSKLPILLLTHFGEYYSDKEFFAGDPAEFSRAEKLISVVPGRGFLISNFDDETIREFKNRNNPTTLTFGFGARADMRATDVLLTHFPATGTNFKINHRGNTVPVWLEKTFGKEQIYAALAAAAIGEVLGLNLVEVSKALKAYQSLPGKMQLIPGIKNSWILDDSAGASVVSTAEALDILSKIPLEKGRKIAVLGDILGAKEHTPDAHEAIGEKAAKTADLLFTVGSRAKFFAEGAVKAGMAKDKIFKFNTAKEAGLAVQKTLQEADLVLVDGSKEISMMEIVDEIKAGPIV